MVDLFKTLGDAMNPNKKEIRTVEIKVKSWRNTDKYDCPGCSKKVSMPNYTCEDCGIKVKPIMKF